MASALLFICRIQFYWCIEFTEGAIFYFISVSLLGPLDAYRGFDKSIVVTRKQPIVTNSESISNVGIKDTFTN
jgi:hypothetical protein